MQTHCARRRRARAWDYWRNGICMQGTPLHKTFKRSMPWFSVINFQRPGQLHAITRLWWEDGKPSSRACWLTSQLMNFLAPSQSLEWLKPPTQTHESQGSIHTPQRITQVTKETTNESEGRQRQQRSLTRQGYRRLSVPEQVRE
jgi:hypothetical protein